MLKRFGQINLLRITVRGYTSHANSASYGLLDMGRKLIAAEGSVNTLLWYSKTLNFVLLRCGPQQYETETQ